MPSNNIIGIDLSLNHFAAVVLDANIGDIIGALYTYQTKKYVHTMKEPFPITGIHVPGRKTKLESKQHYDVRRWHAQMSSVLVYLEEYMKDAYVALEDYATGAETSRILQIAELTGMIKMSFISQGGHIRLIEPKSLKMFGAHAGNALKIDMVRAAENSMGYKIPDVLLRPTKTKTRAGKVPDLDGPGTDIADAYHLARALWLERQVKTGKLLMENVDPYIREKLFYRVTKANPTSIMDQDYWEKPDND